MANPLLRDADLSLVSAGPADHQAIARFSVGTRGPGLVDVTGAVAQALREGKAGDGLATLFVRHTSASLTIQENASPEVLDDLVDALDRLAPRDAGWRHGIEGPDDMPAHVKTMLTGVSLSIPVIGGRLALGTWQAVYLLEHRDRPHAREIVVHFSGRKAV
ncbi:secondary thiamine-phosphate synthase enzyme YjbQ [Chenggangzhangella methanolivorans]|uniref:Secondary thiamine-phosphate synthase enzyme YjbQ n=1 Tax=Chenggangzhangella methanolivorans TaxID=1437009 RepID=A0A9E6RE97_9HYPH|nr:secondary thiamine-phosphate synthase enzyme YjbQ [Chenggangzhangella methanolivorans]QZO01839.1 secondary thiamine-phosphate synthase enzyme YjbQ [Chenggangzhangella methanolivorans]